MSHSVEDRNCVISAVRRQPNTRETQRVNAHDTVSRFSGVVECSAVHHSGMAICNNASAGGQVSEYVSRTVNKNCSH